MRSHGNCNWGEGKGGEGKGGEGRGKWHGHLVE